MSCRPEENRTQRVEGKTHQDGGLIPKSFENFGSDRGEEEITVRRLASNTQQCNNVR